MKEKLESIVIGTENLETIEIPIRHVMSFMVDGITKFVAKDCYSDETFSGENATVMHLILKPEADKRLRERYNAKTVFERLTKFKDITNISLIYENSCRDISFQWKSPDFENIENETETIAMCPNGCMYICIEEGHTAEEYAKSFR